MDVLGNLSAKPGQKEQNFEADSIAHHAIDESLIKQEHDIVSSSYGSIIGGDNLSSGPNYFTNSVTDGYEQETVQIEEPVNLKVEKNTDTGDHLEELVKIEPETIGDYGEVSQEDTADVKNEVIHNSDFGNWENEVKTEAEILPEIVNVGALKSEMEPNIDRVADKETNNRDSISTTEGYVGTSAESFSQNPDSESPVISHAGEKPYPCTLCGKSYSSKRCLKVHTRLHTGERPHSCTECGKSFTQSSALKKHSLQHTGERPYSCTICGKSYTQQSHLTKHKLLHTGEKPYPCTVCGKAFTEKSILTQHKLSHTGEKPHSCTTCGKSFNLNTNLTRHMLSHTGEKPYPCKVCEKTFSQKSHLARHMLSHTGEKQHTCTVCGKSFNSKYTLKRHGLLHAGQ